MKTKPSERLELGRVRDGEYASGTGELHGAFITKGISGELKILSSGVDHEYGWEHVSVSMRDKIPSWSDMRFVKALFWDPEECVVQYHPPASAYVDCHPYCLHLWRPVDGQMPLPPSHLVGPKR